MKLIKKILLGLSVLLALLLILAVILPVIYRDSIRKSIDAAIAQNVNAEVLYKAEQFNFSLLRHFPDFSASTGAVGIFNREPFQGEHLFVAEDIRIEINLWDLLFGKEIVIKGITLVDPDINIKILKDGRANYDITFPAPKTTESDSISAFSFSIDHWQIIRGKINYQDESFPFGFSMANLEHEGSGSFNEKSFDLQTASSADSLKINYNNTTYLSDKHINADAVIQISEAYSRFIFKNNEVKINDLALGFNGWFKMNPDNYEMDISWNTNENSFKNLLSLIPPAFLKDQKLISASGNVKLAGFVKGIFNDDHLPAFQLIMQVKDGLFKYPDLPESVADVALDLQIDHTSGSVKNTRIDLKNLHAKIGTNPLDAKLIVEDLIRFPVDANVRASIDLSTLNKVLPVSGITMKGKFDIKATAKGIYDSVRHIMPSVAAEMKLTNGFLKKSDVPVAAEQIDAELLVNNPTGKMDDFTLELTKLKMLLGQENIQARVTLRNMNDYEWNVSLNGGFDLGNFTSLFPMEGVKLGGKLLMNLNSSGKYSDLKAGRYDRLPAKGSVSINKLRYTSNDLTLPVEISSAELSIDPKILNLKKFESNIGKSDFSGNGTLRNYIGFISGTDNILEGDLNLKSKRIDLNEFMTGTETTDNDTTAFSVIPVPANLNLGMNLTAEMVQFQTFSITRATGNVQLKDGMARLNVCNFTLLDGGFTMSGIYDPRKLSQPLYDFDLSINNLSIRQAANSFSLVKKFAPVAGLANGNFSLDFKISGAMDGQLSPVAETLNASGVVEIKEASVTGSKAIGAVTALTKLKDSDKILLKDVKLAAEIRDGQLNLKPFDLTLGDLKTSISGFSTLSGKLNYVFKMNIPSDRMGNIAAGFLSQAGVKPGSTIPVNILLGGTWTNPKPAVLSAEDKKQVEEVVKTKLEEEGKTVIQEAAQSAQAKALLNKLNLQDSAKTDSTDTKTQVQQLLENKLKGLLRKKKN